MALVTCVDCGKQFSDLAASCIHCGRPMKQAHSPTPLRQESSDQLAVEARVANEKKSTGLAYLLFFLLGSIGVHNFYLGRGGLGALQLVCFGLGSVLVGVAAAQEQSGRSSDAVGFLLAAVVAWLVWVMWGVSLLVDLFVIPSAVQRHTAALREQVSKAR